RLTLGADEADVRLGRFVGKLGQELARELQPALVVAWIAQAHVVELEQQRVRPVVEEVCKPIVLVEGGGGAEVRPGELLYDLPRCQPVIARGSSVSTLERQAEIGRASCRERV